MSTSYNPKIVTDGLIACLDAANSKSYPGSGTNFADLVSSYDATLTNGPGFDAGNLGSITFNGSNQYAPFSTANLPYGSSPYTMDCWAKTNTITGGYSWVISYGTPSTGQARFLGINANTFRVGGFAGTSDISSGGILAVPLDTWFYFVGVYDGTNAYMYVDGEFVTSGAKTWNTAQNNAQLGRQVNNLEYWNGKIARVSIYNRALSAAEIKQNFDALRGRFGL